MRRRLTPAIAVVLLAGLAVVSAAQQEAEDLSSPTLRIEWAAFKKLYDAKQIEVVDIRDRDAFKLGRIPGARSIPLDEVGKHVETLKKLKKPIVTYCACRGEDSSARAALLLQKKGVDARALVGGYHKWLEVEARAERGLTTGPRTP
jgi:rhodanese-related sulfurtransferase